MIFPQSPQTRIFHLFPNPNHMHCENYSKMLLPNKSGAFGPGSHLHPAFFLMQVSATLWDSIVYRPLKLTCPDA